MAIARMVVGDILDVINNTFNDVWPASYLQLMVVGGFHVPQRVKCRHVHRCLFAWNSDISVFFIMSYRMVAYVSFSASDG